MHVRFNKQQYSSKINFLNVTIVDNERVYDNFKVININEQLIAVFN